MKKTIILGAMLVFVLAGCGLKSEKEPKTDELKAKVEAFINANLASRKIDAKASVQEMTEESGLFKVILKIDDATGSQNIDVYVSKDGSKLFDVPADLNKTIEKPNTPNSAQEVNNKTDKPAVELFVMSHCPFGTQIEKGILPVLDTLGNKIDFKLKFCNYAMHGEKELSEEMTQYCIQKNEPAKLKAYLKCFLASASGESADSAKCVKDNKINEAKLKSCVAATDKQFKVKSDFADKETWTKDKNGDPAFPTFKVFDADNQKYNVGGSPTLVINGETISTGRDSEKLLKAICSAFKTAPGECQAKLSSENPSSGFGAGAASNGSASCATN